MALAGKNILIVDDDASHRILLRKILESAGCSVEDAESVKVSLEKIQSKFPDLIILDLNMPEHDGFTLLKFRSQNRLMQSIPVLVLSSSDQKSVIDRALAMGANQFLEKPLKANWVLQKLRFLFYSKEVFSYTFPTDQRPSLEATINAQVVGHSEGQLKLSSVVKFERGKPLQLKIESYAQQGGATLVGRVDHRKIELGEGVYGQILTLVGMSQEEKERFQQWLRTR